MKKTFLLSCILLIGLLWSAKAQTTHPVILQVIDQTKGEITNAEDHNETNIFCWLDDALKATNPNQIGGDGNPEWWYPMYNDAATVNYTNGELVKTEDAWEWTLELQALPGQYEWTPHAKSLGWEPINQGMYPYVGDNGNNLVFTVGEDGTVSGHYQLIISEVIDYNQGIMYLVVTVPAGTQQVWVRGLYDDWFNPVQMTFNEIENAFMYEIDGTRIPVGMLQSYKYYYGDDDWEKIEANADGSIRGDGDNRTLTFEQDGIQRDEVPLWYNYNPAGVKNIENPDATAFVSNNSLEVRGNFSSVKLYTVTGNLIESVNATHSYFKSGLPNGAYLIDVDGYMQKVIIK